MADDNPDLDEQTSSPDLKAIFRVIVDEQMRPERLEGLGDFLLQFGTAFLSQAVYLLTLFTQKALTPIVEGFMRGEAESEESFAELAAVSLNAMLGTSIDAASFRRFGKGKGAGEAIGAGVLAGLANPSTPLEPTADGAHRYLGMVSNLAVEGWLNGFMFELLAEMGTFGHVDPERFADLKDTLISAFGFSRLSRRVLGPYVNATITAPFTWHVNKTYRPTLLSPAAAAVQYYRGRWTLDQAKEEIARHGYDESRTEALLNASAKVLSISDVLYMRRQGAFTVDGAATLLHDQGYDDLVIAQIEAVEQTRALAAIYNSQSNWAIAAYEHRLIDRAEMLSWVGLAYPDAVQRQAVIDALDARAAAPRKRISKAEIEEAVTRSIVSMVDYRQWLADEGYDPASASILELSLLSKVNTTQEAARERARITAEKTAAAAAKAADVAAKKAAAEADQATREPSLADVRQAVVRGILPITTYAAALDAAKYTADDAAFLLEMAQQDRDARVLADEKRAAADRPSAARQLSLDKLDAATLAGVFSLAEYRARLAAAGFAPADVDVLAGVMTRKLADQADATARRAAADATLQPRGLSRADEESAVRRGVLSLDQYRAWLAAQGFTEGDAAILVDTLAGELAARSQAQQLATAANAATAAKPIPLATLEAAVVAGVRSIDDYRAAVVAAGYDPIDQATLVALVQQKADDAAAARAAHDAAAAASQSRSLTLAQIERAVILGTVTLDAYREYVGQLGYDAAGVAVLVGNLAATIQATRARESTRAAAAARLAGAGGDLGALETDVLAGVATLDQYRTELAARGLAAADVATLAGLLADRVAAASDAAQLAATVDATLKPKQLSIGQWEAAVQTGTRSLGDFAAFLQSQGYGAADVQILATLVAQKIAAAPAAPPA